MEEILHQELINLAQQILQSKNETSSISKLKENAKNLYETIIVLDYLLRNDQLSEVLFEQDFSENNSEQNTQNHTNATPEKPSENKEQNTKKEEFSENKTFISESKTFVSENKTPTFEELFAQTPTDVVFQKKEPTKTPVKTLNEVANTGQIQIGLNDKIAFVHHLFSANETEFLNAIQTLQHCSSRQQAIQYIEQEIKPRFQWKGKEAYQERFMQIIMKKFN